MACAGRHRLCNGPDSRVAVDRTAPLPTRSPHDARVHPEATAASLSEGADYELLAQRFRPIFARIAEGAVERERQRELPHEAIAWLKQAGFGAVRVPREHGAPAPRCRSWFSC